MKELAEKASVAEVGQHLAAAQEILGNGAEASQIVAFLLKQYFGNQAADAERRSRQAQNDARRDEGGSSQEARGEGEGGSREGGRDGGRRRRDRGRDRDRGGERGGDRGGDRPRRGEMSAAEALGAGGGEMSAADALAGEEGGPDEGGSSVEGEAGEGGRRRRRRRRRGRGRGEREGGVGGMETLDAAEMLAREPGSAGTSSGPVVERLDTVPVRPSAAAVSDDPNDGLKRLRVNIGFDDGFKGRGAVAKKIASLAGLNEGIVHEVEARRDHAVLKATADIAELVVERVDGATIGKKVVSIAAV